MKKWLTISFYLPVKQVSAQHREDTVGGIRPIAATAVHDTVMIKEGSTYYLFSTGLGISCFYYEDLKNWEKKPVFASAPQWAVEAILVLRAI
ncbi:MAG TPA: hypothetical protein PKC39_05760 [Ferruginibacter sp.]|nr:hypothetical protein [Ferruginibacter sp.]HMP20447.1 hypothetical protein [Ferruginibacter sp.]